MFAIELLLARPLDHKATALCREKSVAEEQRRVEAVGGWVSSDGRVCDMIAVSRAFGDWEFKGDGLPTLLQDGIEQEWWDEEFAAGVKFTGDVVTAEPSVSVFPVSKEAGDEFLVIATDGLWCDQFCLHNGCG
ncbi:MAG: hypothetical protein HC858_02200 [Brachymonas sp.]|nr:hypothetical protein [Brachymonas sp.]